jgi:hypothetical protein|tara:strand:- start:556 stop:885 length:330 start_codon:yes stop_codon:yes gene_type:complete
MKTKTIDINAKEWFDKINGNSYFAGTITINYGMKTEETFLMPFQYGYGSSYEQEAKKILTEFNIISADYGQGIYSYCKENNIILRGGKDLKCLKRDLKQIETNYNNNLK